jgi:hypothetical protein
MLTVAAMQFTLTKVGKLLGQNNCVATPIRVAVLNRVRNET